MCLFIYVCIYVGLCISVSLIYLSHPSVVIYLSANTFTCWSFTFSDLSILFFSGGCVYISMYVSVLVFAYLYLWFTYLILQWWSTSLPIHLPMLILYILWLSILFFSGGCVYISMYVSMLVFAYLYLWFTYIILQWWSTYLPIHLPMLIF